MSLIPTQENPLTQDAEKKVRDIVAVMVSPLDNDMKDMKGNIKDYVYDATLKALRTHQKENCTGHIEQTNANTKKLKRHDVWLWILSGAVGILILIRIFAVWLR